MSWPTQYQFELKTIGTVKSKSSRVVVVAAGIDYLGIHYTKAHENYSQELNQAVTDKKFEILVEQDLWISDKVAQCMITTKSSIEKCNKDNLVR